MSKYADIDNGNDNPLNFLNINSAYCVMEWEIPWSRLLMFWETFQMPPRVVWQYM